MKPHKAGGGVDSATMLEYWYVLCVRVCVWERQCVCVRVFVCEVLARDSSCPLGFANVALPPLQQHGTVSVFVVKLALCVRVCVIPMRVRACVFACPLEREVSKKN